jgi:hypothetical protein
MEMLLKRLKEFPGYCPRTPTEAEPYLEYLTTLYDEIVDFLEANIFSFITLRAETTQHAVAPAQPSHRRSRALPISFSSAALKVRTRKIDKRLQEKPGRLFRSFADAFTHYHGRVLMLGAPGAGETTTLMAYAREATARRMENPRQPLPLMARISDWPSHEAPSLAEWFGNTIGQLESKQVAQTISQGKGLLRSASWVIHAQLHLLKNRYPMTDIVLVFSIPRSTIMPMRPW